MKNLLKPILVAFVLIIIVIVVGSIMISKSMKEAAEGQQLANNAVVNQVEANSTTTNVVDNNTVENEVVNNTVANDVTENTVTNTVTTPGTGNIYEIYAKKQFAMPEVGEEIAIITVKDFGQIAVKFFPKVAPKAVENFVTHAKNGYYNGVTFHRVINEFMIQGGDPKGDGTGGETIWGKGISEELSNELVPYRGALMMASAGTGTSTIGSQFFIVQANYNPTMRKTLYNSGWSSDLLDAYRNYGGYMSLYGNYTLFGQVISGMDVVDKIAAVATAPDIDKPLSDVIIERIDVTTYQGQ